MSEKHINSTFYNILDKSNAMSKELKRLKYFEKLLTSWMLRITFLSFDSDHNFVSDNSFITSNNKCLFQLGYFKKKQQIYIQYEPFKFLIIVGFLVCIFSCILWFVLW